MVLYDTHVPNVLVLSVLDINECIERNPCLYGGTCRNTDGGYFCICPQGRTGQMCEQSKN